MKPSSIQLLAIKPASAWFLILLLGACALAQVAGNAATKAAGRAVIEGMVTKEPGSEPVKKAVIELIAENQAEGGDYTAVSGPDGGFRIEGIVPGTLPSFRRAHGIARSRQAPRARRRTRSDSGRRAGTQGSADSIAGCGGGAGTRDRRRWRSSAQRAGRGAAADLCFRDTAGGSRRARSAPTIWANTAWRGCRREITTCR